jgi:Cd2+/Zn2+-exporting ATPase
MRVAGTDCSACTIKIENALKRLPGVSDIYLNYTTARVLQFDRGPI